MACIECDGRVARMAAQIEQIKVLRLRERHGYEGALATFEGAREAALAVIADLDATGPLSEEVERVLRALVGDQYAEVRDAWRERGAAEGDDAVPEEG